MTELQQTISEATSFPMGEAPVHKDLIPVGNDKFAEAIFFNRPKKRVICFSTQLSCAVGCAFCASPGPEKTTNLTVQQMLQQIVVMMKRYSPPEPTNPILFSFMGEGEPLLNYHNVLNLLHMLPDLYRDQTVKLALSTSGPRTDKIEALAREDFGVPFKLQVSIHSVNPEVRQWLIPQAKPLNQIRDAIDYYHRYNSGPVELNVTLMKGVNDSTEDARQLAEWFGNRYIKVSQFNPVDNAPFLESSDRYQEFVQELKAFGAMQVEYHATDGSKIGAACGQTRGRYNAQ